MQVYATLHSQRASLLRQPQLHFSPCGAVLSQCQRALSCLHAVTVLATAKGRKTQVFYLIARLAGSEIVRTVIFLQSSLLKVCQSEFQFSK